MNAALLPTMSMMDAVGHQQSLLETVQDTRTALACWFARAAGVVEGYYLAGAVSNFERESAFKYLRGLYQHRLAMIEIREQAKADGIT